MFIKSRFLAAAILEFFYFLEIMMYLYYATDIWNSIYGSLACECGHFRFLYF